VLSIMDRGPGIPAEAREAVFRPFYRLEQSRSAQTGGSGLGLAIARQLAEANQWTIELLPRDGGGTVARVGIPVGRNL
jgi:two-component system osmolarity sensor histidine kinase EnvZ